MRRGLSTLLAATIVAAVALSVFVALFTTSQKRAATSTSNLWGLLEYTDLHEVTKLAVVTGGDTATLRNIGRSPVELEYLVLNTAHGVEMLKVEPGSSCRVLGVNEACSTLLNGSTLVATITKSGVIVFPERAEVEVGSSEATLIIPITFSFRNLGDLSKEFDVDPELVAKPYPGQSGKRGISGGTRLLLPRGREDEYYNDRISTVCTGSKDNRVPFGVLVVGYDPSWVAEKAANLGTQPRYSVLIAGPPFTGQEKLCTSKDTIPLTQQGFRVKIANFTGTIMIYDSSGRVVACSSSNPDVCRGYRSALGTWYYVSSGWTLYIDGSAGYIAYYQRSTQGQPLSYEPFLFLGDLDGNGLVDILLVTEDAYYGDSSKYDDSPDNRSTDLLDYSTEPLKLKLLRIGYVLGSPDGSIDGGKYSAVVLYLNLVFHDNSYPDENQLDDIDRNDWVLRILLVDEGGNELIVREYRYQEICNYHKTVVTDIGRDNYFTKLSQSIYIPIPGPGKYWVVIALQDPYYYQGTRNDADITVGVEIIGALPLSR